MPESLASRLDKHGHVVACVGEVMLEISTSTPDPQAHHDVPDHSGLPSQASLNFAGDTFNAAVYLRRALQQSHQVRYVSCVGRDTVSDLMLDFITRADIDTSFINRSDTRTPGAYLISTDNTGERSFSYWRSHSAARTLFQSGDKLTSFDSLNGATVIYLSGISLAILPDYVRCALLDWIATFRQAGGIFVFDSNYRPALWENTEIAQRRIDQTWCLCDIALPSLDDEMALFDEDDEQSSYQRLLRYQNPVCVLKRGALGPISVSHPDISASYPQASNVVDTTAAGDSFSGAFLACYLHEQDVAKAMIAGHERALQVIGHRGAICP